jgi:uncharacterized protein
MDKIQELKKIVEKHIEYINEVERFTAISHLSGVADICAMLSYRRNLDTTLSTASGLLHDLWRYETGIEDDHAEHGAELAKEILNDLDIFNKSDIKTITTAIRYHSDKGNEHGDYDELLKDADVIQHYLVHPEKKYPNSKARRIKNTLRELGINIKVKKK